MTAKTQVEQPAEGQSQEDFIADLEARRLAYARDTQLTIFGRDDTGHDLTVEEMLFVRSYMIDRNPVATFNRLGYADASPSKFKVMAARMLANPEVTAAIDTLAARMAAKLEVTAERVHGQLRDMAFFDVREVMTFDGNSMRVLPSELWNDRQIAAIKSVRVTKDAGIEIQLVDKLKATEVLGRQLNMLEDPDVTAAKAMAEAGAAAAFQKISDVIERATAKLSAPDQQAEDERNAATVQ